MAVSRVVPPQLVHSLAYDLARGNNGTKNSVNFVDFFTTRCWARIPQYPHTNETTFITARCARVPKRRNTIYFPDCAAGSGTESDFLCRGRSYSSASKRFGMVTFSGSLRSYGTAPADD